MRAKFGPLPADAEARVEAVTEPDVLEALLLRVLTANNLEEMELPPLP